MTTISTKIPDVLFRHATSIAEREDMTLDQFIALALASQISSWEIGKSLTDRAENGDWEKAKRVLATAPDTEPDDFDKL
jgi:hypothetical protein